MKIDAWLMIFAFQVQIEVMQKRQKEKTAMMNAVKKYQKGNISHFLMFPKKVWWLHTDKIMLLFHMFLWPRCIYVQYLPK